VCSRVLANGNTACSYKKRHKFIRDKRISLFLRQSGKTGRKEEDKMEELREKNREKRMQERGKGNGLLVSSIHNGRVISGNPKKRPNIAGFLQFENTILFRKSGDESHAQPRGILKSLRVTSTRHNVRKVMKVKIDKIIELVQK